MFVYHCLLISANIVVTVGVTVIVMNVETVACGDVLHHKWGYVGTVMLILVSS